MILWGLHSAKYLDVCKFYRQIYDTPSVVADEAQWTAALRNIVFFVVLAPYDNEQSDLLERVSKDDKLTKVPESLCVAPSPSQQHAHAHKSNLIKCFTTPELMRWPGIESLYGDSLRKTKAFGSAGVVGIAGDVEETESHGDARWEDLHNRVVEHVRRSAHSRSREADCVGRTSAPSPSTTPASPSRDSLSCWTSTQTRRRSSSRAWSSTRRCTPRSTDRQDSCPSWHPRAGMSC